MRNTTLIRVLFGNWTSLFIVLCIGLLSQTRICSTKCWDPEYSDESLSSTNTTDENDEYEDCKNGKCVKGTCECNQGWKGDYCDECGGRVLLNEDSGFISDGEKDYAKARECSWLIQPTSVRNDDIIRLRFLEFASECGWDYLYIYDGDSVFSPILATFNGLILTPMKGEDLSERFLPEVVARSGSVFLHFSSDVEYAMKGFNISYSVESCPQHCSTRGFCNVSTSEPTCECNSTWSGEACERLSCPANCSEEINQGYCSNFNSSNFCECKTGYQGDDCSSNIPVKQGFWQQAANEKNSFNLMRASHTSVIHDNKIWSYGGIQFGELYDYDAFHVYNLTSAEWREIKTNSAVVPSPRYGHSMVSYNDKFILFGGRDTWSDDVKDEVWEYNILTNMWSNISYTADFYNTNENTTSPLKLWGHTSVLVNFENGTSVMVVMFGFNPEYEYSGFVFEYNADTYTWSKALTNGAVIEAAYGHAMTWDPVNNVCYVHGGYVFLKLSTYGVTDATYSYDPQTRNFKVLRSSGVPRYLHSTVLINGVLFSYGGCTHNDSDRSTGALCFSPSFMAYHISCDTWEHISPPNVTYQPNRYGHTAISASMGASETNMVIYGGYNSVVLDNILVYKTGSCSSYSQNKTSCSGTHHIGLSCFWNNTECVASEIAADNAIANPRNLSCNELTKSSSSYCGKLSSVSCNNTAACCSWMDDACTAESDCKDSPDSTIANDTRTYCRRFRSCVQCDLNSECRWHNNICVVRGENNETATCIASCGSFNTCSDCSGGKNCMWCLNKGLCVSTTSYVVQFPYGECMKWLNKNSPASCAASESCTNIRTCDSCQSDAYCGWCDDGSETGLGTCQSGTGAGSRTSNTSANVISGGKLVRYNTSTPACSKDHWYFTECPVCQCNGHSKCDNGTSDCINCENQTSGNQCQQCIDGYYGNATNGGSCNECECFGRATSCNNTTGLCFCNTKGEIGAKCDQCDTASKYYGDPTDNGTCYYRLLINYSFTFTLTNVNDRYVTAINFENVPPAESDAELNFEARDACDVRLTVYYLIPVVKLNVLRSNATDDDNSTSVMEYKEQEIEVAQKLGVTKFDFSFVGSRYGFGDASSNATIRIYVSNFTVPTWIQVSLVQRNTSLLMLLLILFSCFLVLLLLTAVAWKLKLTYDRCQHRRQRADQLEQMAARPYSTIHLCLDDIHAAKKTSDQPTIHSAYSSQISAICEESSADGRVAAVSVIFWMPANTADDPGSMLTLDEDKSMKEHSPAIGSICMGTALLSSLNRIQTSEIDSLEHQRTGSVSRGKKYKVFFKRGGRMRTSERRPTSSQRAATSSCGAQLSQNNSRDNVVPGESGNTTEDTERVQTNLPRQRSKRGRSFTSLRSRSVSPTGSSSDNRANQNQQIADNTRRFRPHPIVLAYDDNTTETDRRDITV